MRSIYEYVASSVVVDELRQQRCCEKGNFMDLSSINSAYNSLISDNAAAAKASKAVDAKRDYSKATDDELMEACKKFEAYFLEQCFKEMWKTTGTPESDSAAMNTLKDYYTDTLISEVATQSTEKSSLGLAQMLYEQMKRNYNITDTPE